MNTKSQLLRTAIKEEVRKQLREFNKPQYFEKNDHIISPFGEKFIVTREGPGYGFTAKNMETGEIRKFTGNESLGFSRVDTPSLLSVKSGPFKMDPKKGAIMKNGKRIYDVQYYDDNGSYEVKLPLADASGRKLPKKSMFFDSAQEVIDWFRKTDSKFDWETAFDRIEKPNISIYDYD